MRVMLAEIDEPAKVVRRRFGDLLLIRQDLTLEQAAEALDRVLSARDEVGPPTDEAKLRDAAGSLLAVAEAHGGHYRSPRAVEAMQR